MLSTVHRPQTVEEALQLLNRKDRHTAVLAGGTSLIPNLGPEVDELVDLQAIGMQGIEHSPTQMKLGALTTLQRVVEDAAAPDIICQLAQREGPNTLRHIATIGGVIASGDGESELLAALLVCDAAVTIQKESGVNILPITDFLSGREEALAGGIITAVTLSKPSKSAHARVARTPQDKPIVAAVATRSDDGHCQVALCGVAANPILLAAAEISALNPPGDFRGTSAYRKEMAQILIQRVLAACS